jgi:hypothetical protein
VNNFTGAPSGAWPKSAISRVILVGVDGESAERTATPVRTIPARTHNTPIRQHEAFIVVPARIFTGDPRPKSIRLAACQEPSAESWRWVAGSKIAGVAAFDDLGTHMLDILIWLLGDIESVAADIRIVTGRYSDCDENGQSLSKRLAGQRHGTSVHRPCTVGLTSRLTRRPTSNWTGKVALQNMNRSHHVLAIRVNLTPDQVFSLLLLCGKDTAPRWQRHLERAVYDPESLP